MPSLQGAANPWHQGEGEKDINQHVQNKQAHEKHTYELSSPSVVNVMLKGPKTQGQNTRQKQ